MVPRQLVESARQGNQMAKSAICDELRPKALRTAGHYARQTGVDKDDLLQEFWVGVFIGLEEIDATIGSPIYYLFLRGKWRLLELIRRSHRAKTLSLNGMSERLTDHSMEKTIESESVVDKLLAGQPTTTRKQVLVGILNGYQQQEIANQLGCTAANVSYHVRKIRNNCKSIMAE